MKTQGISLWGAADLEWFSTPGDETGKRFANASSWVVPMNPRSMESIQNGPNRAYADDYARVNDRINDLAGLLAGELKKNGFRALALAASVRSDQVNIKGDFPDKTAATRAGLGWIGKHCQLITRPFGPGVRLGTVFADLSLPGGAGNQKALCS